MTPVTSHSAVPRYSSQSLLQRSRGLVTPVTPHNDDDQPLDHASTEPGLGDPGDSAPARSWTGGRTASTEPGLGDPGDEMLIAQLVMPGALQRSRGLVTPVTCPWLLLRHSPRSFNGAGAW